ncbi:LysR substrate-binding domain-containing protein [Nonomuraea polychroma]|uniref:LysR substrate-binding domain-containing protein n=1 Tax=Nonomuraea polychroma TaxID=46176 RepID=UPI000FDEF3D4|nr:LysR substrate-binding domain-containing protein [Nonomuraea polychroma]
MPPTLRVGIIDAGYDTMPQILRELRRSHPEITIHQVEAGTPEQYRQLADGRLDVVLQHRCALRPLLVPHLQSGGSAGWNPSRRPGATPGRRRSDSHQP